MVACFLGICMSIHGRCCFEVIVHIVTGISCLFLFRINFILLFVLVVAFVNDICNTLNVTNFFVIRRWVATMLTVIVDDQSLLVGKSEDAVGVRMMWVGE